MKFSPIFPSWFFALATLLSLLVMSQSASAQNLFERLVMPGDLIEGHADLQKECSNCHTSFFRGAQVQLCLSCHKDVAEDINNSVGFHGKSTEAQASECSHCHTDHLGKDADIVNFDQEIFDHTSTDFTLKGAHTSTTCASCHEEGKLFRQAPVSCVDCHEKVDPHRTNLGRDCGTCHQETNWSDTLDFDHSKTDFPLVDAHKTVTCSACHVEETYEDLPTNCIGCHRIQDVHQDRFGEKCETCHRITNWSEVRFDHDKDTDFSLLGEHREASCKSCHETNVFQQDTGASCVSCHRQDDAHDASLGTECATCHNADGWLENVAFDHGLTQFPLIGLHVLAPCEACHIDNTFQNAQVTCQSCHLTEDVHKGGLGSKCESCHNPNGWEFWIFNHDQQTDFRLTGKHNGLKCAACHRQAPVEKVAISRSCIACHQRDDKHRGMFGTQCSACHNTNSFKGARLR